MEPPIKRQRLSTPNSAGNAIAQGAFNYYELSNYRDASLGAGQTYEAEDPLEDEEEVELEQKRALADKKLKSRFEAIFEKYERDFTGIGDEIDLKTGEIIVDNGHLVAMQDERDAGSNHQRPQRVFSQGLENIIPMTEEEESEGARDGDGDESSDEYADRDEDSDNIGRAASQGIEDDGILYRDSTIASSHHSPPRTNFHDATNEQPREQHEDCQSNSTIHNPYPSETEILAQFGSQLGPRIVQYVSQQRDTNIEPAWRVPGNSPSAVGKRPILRSMLLQPTETLVIPTGAPGKRPTSESMPEKHSESDRSQSPESSSIWAAKMPPGRPRKDGADVAAIFKGEIFRRNGVWYSTKSLSEYRASDTQIQEAAAKDSSEVENAPVSNEKLKHHPQAGRSPLAGIRRRVILCEDSRNPSRAKRSYSKPMLPRKPRQAFTLEEENLVVEWVREAQRQGYSLWGWAHWRKFAEVNKQHTFLSWLDHYRKHIYPRGATFQESDGVNEAGERMKSFLGSDDDTPIPQSPELSSRPKTSIDHHTSTARTRPLEEGRPNLSANSRSLRVRKPPKNDPSKFSWEEAIKMLEEANPVLHAALLKDSEAADRNGDFWQKHVHLPMATHSSLQNTREVPLPSSIPDSQASSSQSIPSSPLQGLPNDRSGSEKLEEEPERNIIDPLYSTSDDDISSRVSARSTATSTRDKEYPIFVDEALRSPMRLEAVAAQEDRTSLLQSKMRNPPKSWLVISPQPDTRITPKPSPKPFPRRETRILPKHRLAPKPQPRTNPFPQETQILLPRLAFKPQPSPSSNSPTGTNFVPTQAGAYAQGPPAGSQSLSKLAIQQVDLLPLVGQELLRSQISKPGVVPKPTPVSTPSSVPKQSRLSKSSPKLNSNPVLKPNSVSKPTIASKSKPLSEPALSTPTQTSNPGLVQSTTQFPKPNSTSKSNVESKLSLTPNARLASKSSSERKPQQPQDPPTPTKRPKPRKLRLSNILPDDDIDELGDFLVTSPQSTAQNPKSRIAGLTDKIEGTPKSVEWRVSFNASEGSDSGDLLIRTPGESRRNCGDSGFRCDRGFCFKCE